MSLALLAALVSVTAPVPVVVTNGLAPEVVDAALAEVDAIFAPGEVHFRWRVSRGGELAETFPIVVLLQDGPPDRVVYGCRRNRHDHRLGHTHLPARRITLWSRQIVRAVTGDWDSEEVAEIEPRFLSRALGRVLAHELGHLFLGLKEHHERGLMRRSFSHRSLASRNRRAFRLEASDFELLRRELAALAD